MKNIVTHGARNGPDWCYWKTPNALLARFAPEPLVSDFLISRSGYFPQCWHNAAFRPNPLNEAVVSLCLEGRGWIADIHEPDKSRTVVGPGDVIVVPADAPHSYGADAKEPWTQLWFHVVGPRVGTYLAQLGVGGGPAKGHLSRPDKIEASMHGINAARRHGCGRAVLLETAALGELVLARLYGDAGLEPVGRPPKNGDESEAAESTRKLKNITTYFQENYRRELTLGAVAKLYHVSESWLSHAFSEHTGFSPLGFVIHLRLQEACRALATSDRKLEDVAQSVGYRDPFYFSRLFKKHMGLPPSVYRKEYAQ